MSRALVSVYDKTGLEELGRGPGQGRRRDRVAPARPPRRCATAGVAVTAVDELTGFPECLDGRVKTLHPHVHAGILADRRLDDHVRSSPSSASSRSTSWWSTSTRSPTRSRPARRRTSASSRSTSVVRRWSAPPPRTTRRVAVVVEPARYADVLAAVEAGGFTLEQRRALAAKAFPHTASYDVAVASWFARVRRQRRRRGVPVLPGCDVRPLGQVLRYGENPHQQAALYRDPAPGDSLASAEQLHGKAMSLQQLRRHRRGAAGGATTSRHRAWRSSSTPTRAASRSAPTWPRRTARRTPATRCRRSAG